MLCHLISLLKYAQDYTKLPEYLTIEKQNQQTFHKQTTSRIGSSTYKDNNIKPKLLVHKKIIKPIVYHHKRIQLISCYIPGCLPDLTCPSLYQPQKSPSGKFQEYYVRSKCQTSRTHSNTFPIQNFTSFLEFCCSRGKKTVSSRNKHYNANQVPLSNCSKWITRKSKNPTISTNTTSTKFKKRFISTSIETKSSGPHIKFIKSLSIFCDYVSNITCVKQCNILLNTIDLFLERILKTINILITFPLQPFFTKYEDSFRNVNEYIETLSISIDEIITAAFCNPIQSLSNIKRLKKSNFK